MENLSNKINEIRGLIAEIEILNAINQAIDLAESLNLSSFRDEGLLLKMNQMQIRNDKQKNIDEADDLEIRQNRVVNQTLNLLTRMESHASTKVADKIVLPVKPIETKIENESKKPSQNRNSQADNAKSESRNNTILIVIVALVTLAIVGFLLTKILSNKETKSTTTENVTDIKKAGECEEYLKKIETAIQLKAFEKAKKGLIQADKLCDNKLQLQFLLEDYNAALLEASQTENNSVETETKTPETPPATDSNNENNSNPNREFKPNTTIKPGLVKINPEILNIKPELLIQPELLHLDYWTGTWKSTFGNMIFVQVGTDVFGDYEKGKGWLQGKYNPKTKLFEGVFYNAISKKYGQFQFKKNGDSFDGKWGWKGERLSSKWSGALTDSKERVLKYYRNGFIGRVLDEDGKPIARAKVTTNGRTSVFTNTQGLFQMPLPDGSYTITASHTNYESQRLPQKYSLKNKQEKVYFKLKKK